MQLWRPAHASCIPCCCRGDGSAAQAMATRITELVNVTLQAEAGPETQLTEAQVRAQLSAMPHRLRLCRPDRDGTFSHAGFSHGTGVHRNRVSQPYMLCADPTVQVLDLIDQGGSEGGASGRHWVLDPIDGTRGFVGLRQYAICLGMLQDGKVGGFTDPVPGPVLPLTSCRMARISSLAQPAVSPASSSWTGRTVAVTTAPPHLSLAGTVSLLIRHNAPAGGAGGSGLPQPAARAADSR